MCIVSSISHLFLFGGYTIGSRNGIIIFWIFAIMRIQSSWSTFFYIQRMKSFSWFCFSFAEGPLAWALIVWRCSLVFSSADKLVSVLIHLLPGLVFFTIRWWNPATFDAMHFEETSAESHGHMEWKTNPTFSHGCSGCPCLLIPCGRFFISLLSMYYAGRGY
ncbi:hypothetical protein OIU79_003634 [Salix purpurea]|uniref:Glycerophosphocholine acyltransferase 1 n=1 Tax=Salix purpurea TaxID=77065 RepID=A0A9Q0ZFK8_SALPP|nr:hypothetical protein OIU79_003634 [Salix purpurea]